MDAAFMIAGAAGAFFLAGAFVQGDGAMALLGAIPTAIAAVIGVFSNAAISVNSWFIIVVAGAIGWWLFDG